jgi:hypothetical protein
MVLPWWASSGCHGAERLPWKIASLVALSDCVLPRGVWRSAHWGILNGATGAVCIKIRQLGTPGWSSLLFSWRSWTRGQVSCFLLQPLTMRDASGSFVRWVKRWLSSSKHLRLQLCHFKTPCPFLGDVSGSFAMSVEYRLFSILNRSLLLYTQ